MKKPLSFLIVFILTTLSWVVLGYLIQLVFPALSLTWFLIIGLISGLTIGTLLTFAHEDSAVVPGAVPEANATNLPGSDLTKPGIQPNHGADTNLSH